MGFVIKLAVSVLIIFALYCISIPITAWRGEKREQRREKAASYAAFEKAEDERFADWSFAIGVGVVVCISMLLLSISYS